MTRRRERGFALLMVLWALVPVAWLASGLIEGGRGASQVAIALRRSDELRAGLDGAIEEAAFHMLDRGIRRWAADGSLHVLAIAGGEVALRITDEADRVNLNTAPAGLLAALIAAVGLEPGQAEMLAQSIVEWRQDGPRPQADKAAAYRRAGLDHAPPQMPLRSVDELEDVLGMTEPVLAALRPHITVASLYGPGRDTRDPVVARVLEAVRQAGGVLPNDTRFDGPQIVRVAAEAALRGQPATRGAREAILRLDPASRTRPALTVAIDDAAEPGAPGGAVAPP